MIEKLMEVRKNFYEKNEVLFSLENEKNFKGLKSNEVHCICFIRDLNKPNITNLSEKMGITTSGMTKITTRLIKKGYLIKYKQEDNRKEVYFSLTKIGEDIYSAHNIAHEKGFKKNHEFLSTFSEDELQTVINFFERNNDFLDKEIEQNNKDK